MKPIRRAVIVAAGQSSRLRPLTQETPKCLLPVGGISMIDRSVSILRDGGIEEIAVVVGFERRKIEQRLGTDGFTYIVNPFFPVTNNMASLWFARDWAGSEGFLYLHADLVYHPDLVNATLACAAPDGIALLVDAGPTDPESMKVRLAGGRFVESNKGIPLEEAYGEWVGIARFPHREPTIQQFFRTAEEIFAEGDCNAYDTAAFTRMAGAGAEFPIVTTDGLPWIEVDDHKDLERATSLFA